MYEALGAKVPIFAHLPLILGPDKQRLSKRHGATAVGAYQEQGILPEALVNFLALLGWTPPEQKEIVPIEDMIRDFELTTVSKSNAVFDLEKLAWMNSEYVRHMPVEKLIPLVERELKVAGLEAPKDSESFKQKVLLLQSRARTVQDFAGVFKAFFAGDFAYDPDAVKKHWKDAALPQLLDELSDRLAGVNPFDLAGTEAALRALADEKSVKAGLLINATRVALTGQGVAPGLFEVIVALGQGRVTERLRRAAEYLRSSATNAISAD
jgi:glutamyl-tRNA synthetase